MSSTISLTPASARRKALNRAVYIARRNPLLVIGAVVIFAWVLAAPLAPSLATHDILAQDIASRLQPPSAAHLWGTDELGRDIYSRVLFGARITIPAGVSVIIIGSLIGTVIGAVAGFVGGIWDEVIMRLTELFMAFPTIILAMAITAALGPDIRNAIIALVVVWWPSYARLVRGMVLKVKQMEYVEAAACLGAPRAYILWRTVLPNCIAPAIILTTLDIGNAILTFAGLSFLGLGPEPTSPEWGRMVAVGIDYFDQWWTWLFPGMAIASLVIAFNFIGDSLRDLLDPRMR
ncbi:MAG: ABC transporter permease [Anaerolineae bacterium]|nr:ABC transporter permease [Anaerolineae bacterium]